MKRTLFFGILVALLVTSGPNRQLTAQAPVTPISALTGPAVLDDWATDSGRSEHRSPRTRYARKSARPSYS